MSESPQEDFRNAQKSRRGWLWAVAGLVVVGAISAAGVVAARARQSALIDSEYQRLEQLATALNEYAKAHEGELPEDPGMALSGGDAATLLTDVATRKPLTFRVVSSSGERIRYQFIGDRIIAWSPEQSYRGCRAVLLNSCDVRFAPDSVLDLKEQRLLAVDGLNRMRPKMSMAEGEAEDGPPEGEPATEPSTQPGN